MGMDGNILRVGFSESGESPQILIDTIRLLKDLNQSGQLSGGPFIAVNGECSVISAYAICDYLSRLYSTIAIYDPKLNGYVVIKSATTGYQVGEIVNLPERYHPSPLKIVLCGPPHVGKSCLREALKQAMMDLHRQGLGPYPYVLTACPDGEGAWFSETAMRDHALAQQLKAQYKSRFTPAFAAQTARAVANIRLPVTLIDIGGRLSNDNYLIAADATHAIILWRNKFTEQGADRWYSSCEQWQDFCEHLGLEVIAILESTLDGDSTQNMTVSQILTGRIGGLSRGTTLRHHPVIDTLAKTIAHKVWQAGAEKRD